MGGFSIVGVTLIAVALIAVLAGGAVMAHRFRRPVGSAQSATANDGPAADPSSPGAAATEDPQYSSTEIENVLADCFKLAFGVSRFDYQIMGEHAEVMARVGEQARASVHQREYFPRRPMLLPRLLQALNDSESTRQALVRLILEDPALAGSVLRGANSAYYRLTPEPVDSLDRAVQVLGTEGLRGLIATAILQPVFRLPRGYFDTFAPVTWEQAQRCAAAAEAYAKVTRTTDPFVAQLLGLISALARIVLFRLTVDMYRERPNVLPRAEVFIRSMQAHAPRLACLIASSWELSDPSVAALHEQEQGISPARMSALGRAVYFGDLCGALAMLGTRETYSAEGAHAMLVQQGLSKEAAHAMWHAAVAAGRD